MNSKITVFTIVSKNYLHFARTLMASVRANLPEADLIVGLCDRLDGYDPSEEIFSVIEMENLPIENIEQFIFQYTILELNTAIKPFIIEMLFEKYGYDKVIYFDPDIRVYSSLQPMLSLLDTNNILLTPHLTDWLDDGGYPNELSILQSGSYNLGYIGLRNTPEVCKFVTWWQKKLLTECVVDIPRGLFVDQKWIDMAPGMYDGVHINRDSGWNVAYWNLNHRTVVKDASGFTVNGLPLTFFHFSGFSVDSTTLSKHQDRFTLDNVEPAVKELADNYANELQANGYQTFYKMPYAFGTFANGVSIPNIARHVFRKEIGWGDKRFNVFTKEGADSFIAYLNEPVSLGGKTIPWLTRLSYALYLSRNDLQEAFPDISGTHSIQFAYWFVNGFENLEKISALFVEPILKVLEGDKKQAKNYYDIVAEAQAGEVSGGVGEKLYRFLYKAAWKYKDIVCPFIDIKYRTKVHDFLLRKTIDNRKKIESPFIQNELPLGINLIGYVHAESGVGESARSSLRAISAEDTEVSVIDFRAGNVSRMEEKIDTGLSDGLKYSINLFHINADQLPLAYSSLGEAFFNGHYNIGYWAWELPIFPDEWLDSFKFLDEIWVPSSFCQRAISAKSNIPVLCFPHCIDIKVPVSISRSQLGIPENGFIFLNMSDVLSVPERKNPLAVVEAYKRAFRGNTDKVYLVLKISNTEYQPELREKLDSYIANDPSIILIDQYFDRSHINALIASSDCFVSLHRSEGFGLGLAEAMSLGKPVIATGWSGNMEFMTPWNSIPVAYSLKTIEEDLGPYKKGQVWAEPDIDEAAYSMVRVISDKKWTQQISIQAAITIEEGFSPQAIGKRIRERINCICKNKQI